MTHPHIILQARTDSRRLPGKALLDFHGLPLVVLAAKRAGNTGARVTVATSDAPSDNALADTLRRHGVGLVRGPLDDVLRRFVFALQDDPYNTPVVRLTGDNILPDGALIADVLSAFDAGKLDYISTTDPSSGLPFGCAVEITFAGHLRAAAAQAQTMYEREHVTPFIRKRFGVTVFTGHRAHGCGHLRTTIDCLDDYQSLYNATPACQDLTHCSWQAWLEHLKSAPSAPRSSEAVKDMVLGTAQLGMSYGIARRGSPNEAESLAMLRCTINEGVGHVDTARAYGDSEALIGKLLSRGWDGRTRIVTKLSPMEDVQNDTAPSEVEARAEASLLQSCLSLGEENLDIVLLHRATHLRAWNGAAFGALRRWRDTGQVRALGVSVQSPEELDMVLDCTEIEHIQLPCNILDHRWDALMERIRAIRQKRKLVIHVRSALLQGLLSTDDLNLWRRAHVEDASATIDWLEHKSAALGYESIVSLSIAWARGLDWADGVVVGCDSLEQLHDTVRLFNQPALPAQEISILNAERPRLEPRSLDPTQWQSVHASGQTN